MVSTQGFDPWGPSSSLGGATILQKKVIIPKIFGVVVSIDEVKT